MADVLFLLITVAFFVLCVGYVALCERIVGRDSAVSEVTATEDSEVVEVTR
jgi:hypothetical protein